MFARLFILSEQAVCKTLRRTHFYEVKYNALYFTWKLCRNCARLLDKMLRSLASNSLGGLPVIRYSNDAKGGLKNELHSGEDGKNEIR